MSVTADFGNQGVKKLNLAYAGVWKSVQALISGAVFNYGGEHSIYIPGYNAAATNSGRAINVDGRKGYHFFADVAWRNWTFALMSGVQQKKSTFQLRRRDLQRPGEPGDPRQFLCGGRLHQGREAFPIGLEIVL